MTEPIIGDPFTFFLGLVDLTDGTKFVTNPTIAAGDFKVSTDGGALNNLASLPVVIPAGSTLVSVALSALEMSGSKINVVAVDAAGSEWMDAIIPIDAPAASSETVFNILEGDHVETSTNLTINKKNTLDALIQKDISGSLLGPSVTIRTLEP